MRPKKTILLYCPNEVTRDVLTFQMQTWGYLLFHAELEGMMPVLLARPIDLVLLVPGFEHKDYRVFDRIVRRLETWQTQRGAAIRIYDTMHVLRPSIATPVSRIQTKIANVEFLRHALCLLMKRKRGPRTVFGRELLPALHVESKPAQKAMVA